MWFSMAFGSGPLEGVFAEFPFAISAVSNPRVSKALFLLWPFRWPFCEFLTKTVTNLVGRHAHSSGPCPRARLSRFAPAAEKTQKLKKRGPRFSFKTPFFFVQTPPPQAPKIFVQNPKIFVQNLHYGAFSGVAQPFFTKCPKLIPHHPQTLKSSDGPSSQLHRQTRGYSRGMHLISHGHPGQGQILG